MWGISSQYQEGTHDSSSVQNLTMHILKNKLSGVSQVFMSTKRLGTSDWGYLNKRCSLIPNSCQLPEVVQKFCLWSGLPAHAGSPEQTFQEKPSQKKPFSLLLVTQASGSEKEVKMTSFGESFFQGLKLTLFSLACISTRDKIELFESVEYRMKYGETNKTIVWNGKGENKYSQKSNL
jgi:hypothetical protein